MEEKKILTDFEKFKLQVALYMVIVVLLLRGIIFYQALSIMVMLFYGATMTVYPFLFIPAALALETYLADLLTRHKINDAFWERS